VVGPASRAKKLEVDPLIYKTRMITSNNMKTKAEQDKEPLKLYTTKEIAKIWNISYWCIRDLVLDGKIRPIVLGKGWKFTGFELTEAILERL